MIKFTDEFLEELSQKAKIDVRKRINYNLHNNSNETIQRFLNAAEPGTYIQPHKHENPGKVELFMILRGKVLVLEFDDCGKIVDHVILDLEKGRKFVEIPPKKWHSFIALEEKSILLEIKEGPYLKENDKVFADWAPQEGATEAQDFNRKILISFGLHS